MFGCFHEDLLKALNPAIGEIGRHIKQQLDCMACRQRLVEIAPDRQQQFQTALGYFGKAANNALGPLRAIVAVHAPGNASLECINAAGTLRILVIKHSGLDADLAAWRCIRRCRRARTIWLTDAVIALGRDIRGRLRHIDLASATALRTQSQNDTAGPRHSQRQHDQSQHHEPAPQGRSR